MIPLLLAFDEAMLLDELFLRDFSPSSAVASASWDPLTNTAEITFTDGSGPYHFSCSLRQWIEYKNSDSKGSALSSVFGIHGGRR